MGKKTTAAQRAGLFSLPQGEVIFPIPLSLLGMASVKACSLAPPLCGWLTLPTPARPSLVSPFLRVDGTTHWGNGARVGEKKCQKAEGDGERRDNITYATWNGRRHLEQTNHSAFLS